MHSLTHARTHTGDHRGQSKDRHTQCVESMKRTAAGQRRQNRIMYSHIVGAQVPRLSNGEARISMRTCRAKRIDLNSPSQNNTKMCRRHSDKHEDRVRKTTRAGRKGGKLSSQVVQASLFFFPSFSFSWGLKEGDTPGRRDEPKKKKNWTLSFEVFLKVGSFLYYFLLFLHSLVPSYLLGLD